VTYLVEAFSGYNSRWNRIILPKLFPNAQSVSQSEAFVIFLGANDSNSHELNPLQHVPADEYGENLVAMVKYLQSLGVSEKKIVLVGPPPCDTVAWGKACELRGSPMAKDNKVTSLYNDKCHSAATVTSCHFIDIYSVMMNTENWQSFLSDGLHLSKAGSRFLFEQVWTCLDTLTSSLPSNMPEWRDVNADDPQRSLNL